VIFLALGIFVSFIQAFVFSLLSTLYIGLAVAHDH
jgi:F0F1-type ATP synthase membrane subunit a